MISFDGSATQITEHEKTRVNILSNERYSARRIAASLERGKSAVANYLRRGKGNRAVEMQGRPSKLSHRLERLVTRKEKDGHMHNCDILEELNVNFSIWTVQRVLLCDEHMIFHSIKAHPHLTTDRKNRRSLWARQHNFLPSNRWSRSVFTEEKRFFLEGSDGTACFWANRPEAHERWVLWLCGQGFYGNRRSCW